MIYEHLLNTISTKGAAYLILLDPDKLTDEKLLPFVKHCDKSGVDGFLVGGSLIIDGDIKDFTDKIKKITNQKSLITTI